MKKSTIFFYWMLILVPTILISTAAFRLLQHEQARIENSAWLAAKSSADAIADTLQITVEEVENGFTESMWRIPEDRLLEELLNWQANNALVRNVFILHSEKGLALPKDGIGSTLEEKRFVNRYATLFKGHHALRATGKDAPGRTNEIGPALVFSRFSRGKHGSNRFVNKAEPAPLSNSPRQQLVRIARKGGDDKDTGSVSTNEKRQQMSGWIPWFADNRLYILGWAQKKPDGPVYGLELELMLLLSRLISSFPGKVPLGSVYALLDGGGRLIHQTGEAAIDPTRRPDASVSLAPQLPHWRVAVYFTGPPGRNVSGKSYIVLTGLILAIFILTMIAGGYLLIRQAHRNMVDAQKKTSFVSNVSHELKTPLTSIRMFAELLHGDRVKSKEKRKHYLDVIVHESQRLTRLVNNVLDFSRLEQGRKKYHLELIDIKKLLSEIVHAHRLRFRRAGMEIEESYTGRSCPVQTDRDAVEQVVLNLMDNALKYAGNDKKLIVSLEHRGVHVEIAIKDRGPGIPAVHAKRIFDKFHRVDDSLTSSQPGSGLGLTIAKQLLLDLKGDLIFKPRDGGGSCFIIKLPVSGTMVA
jgi:signal transduction histidine kinase